MSQAKVDKYKEEKKNREKTMKKNKVKKVIIVFLIALILGALIGFPLGRWIYNYQQEHQDKEDIFISAHEYEEWFDQYWVDNYSNLYTGSEIATEQNSESGAESTEAGTEGSGTGSGSEDKESGATEEPSSISENLTEAGPDKE